MNSLSHHSEYFLQHIVKKSHLVSVYLKNGIRLQGQIINYSESMVELRDKEKTQMILLDAVSTIALHSELSFN